MSVRSDGCVARRCGCDGRIVDRLQLFKFSNVRTIQHRTRSVHVELSFPTRDYDSCNTIADQVRHGPSFIKKTIDTEKQDQTFDRNFVHRRERRGQRNESSTRD